MLESRPDIHSEPASPDFAIGHQLLGNGVRQASRNRAAEAEPDFVNAHNLALQIYKRTAGVAAIDRRVMTDPAHERTNVLAIELKTAERTEHFWHHHLDIADNSQSDRLRQRHWT